MLRKLLVLRQCPIFILTNLMLTIFLVEEITTNYSNAVSF